MTAKPSGPAIPSEAKPRFRLRLFGGYSATVVGGDELSLPNRKDQALLIYLAVNAGEHQSRDKLASLLWGRSTDAFARHSLRQALSNLRKAGIDTNVLHADRNALLLDPRAVDLDTSTFVNLSGQVGQRPMKSAASMYCGAFLDGFVLDERMFEQWIAEQRDRFDDIAKSVLSRLAETFLARQELTHAIDCARQLMRIDPYDEATLRMYMEILVGTGRDLEALRYFREFSTLLQAELGVEPEQQTMELYLRIADRRRSHSISDGDDDISTTSNLVDAFRSLDGFVVWDSDDKFVLCNDKFREIFAPAGDRLVPGATWEHIVRSCIESGRFPEAVTDPETYVRSRLERRRRGIGDAPDLHLVDGRTYRLAHRRTDSGNLVVIFTDITSRKSRELTLSRSHSRLQALLKMTSIGIEEVDRFGNITFWNNHLCRQIGYKLVEVIGKPHRDFTAVPWATTGTEESASSQDSAKPPYLAPRHARVVYLTRNGGRLSADAEYIAIRDDQRVLTGYIGIITMHARR